MSEKVYVLNVYNTMTGQYELIQVTKEVFQTYRRTKWNIEDSTERFFKHETQMSSLIGGENDGYERFHEFIDYDNTPENQAIEEMVFQSLHNVLELLPPKDYELIYELYFKNHTERECAQRLGMSQQAIHERKKRILKKIKNNLGSFLSEIKMSRLIHGPGCGKQALHFVRKGFVLRFGQVGVQD